jgi:hypothetical protein
MNSAEKLKQRNIFINTFFVFVCKSYSAFLLKGALYELTLVLYKDALFHWHYAHLADCNSMARWHNKVVRLIDKFVIL